MPFTNTEKELLLAARMVGPKVIERLEQVGLDSFAKLKHADYKDVCFAIAGELGASCWKNSPHAQTAIKNAIAVAKKGG